MLTATCLTSRRGDNAIVCPPSPPLPTLASPSTHAHINLLRGGDVTQTRLGQASQEVPRTMAPSGGYLEVGRIAAERKPCEQVSHGARPFISLPTVPPPSFSPLYTRPHPFPSWFGLGLDRLTALRCTSGSGTKSNQSQKVHQSSKFPLGRTNTHAPVCSFITP